MRAREHRDQRGMRGAPRRRVVRWTMAAMAAAASVVAVQPAAAQAMPARESGRAADPGPGGLAPESLGSAAGARVASPPLDGLASLPVSGLASLSVGRGLRFNNPYRLARPLGDSAESVSLAATYLDLGLGLLFGGRDFRHGVALGGAVALQGIGQLVLTPSYLAQLGLTDSAALRGRVGVPIVVAPDTTIGLEAAVGSTLDMAYGFGALLELVGSVYFGAATDQTSITTIPMLSLQVGVFFEHGVLP